MKVNIICYRMQPKDFNTRRKIVFSYCLGAGAQIILLLSYILIPAETNYVLWIFRELHRTDIYRYGYIQGHGHKICGLSI